MGQDLDGLQGTWNIVSLEMDGQKMAGGGAQIVVRGERFTTIAMGAAYEGTLVVHEASAPKSFDLHFEEGPEKGNTSLGIYELEGDTWKICLTTRGNQRPREFAAPPGTGIALETLRRATAADTPVAAEASGLAPGDSAGEIAGEWVPLSLIRDGQPLDKGMLKFGRRTATASEVTVKFGPQVVVQARYSVERSSTPMTMDYALAGGGQQLGIWALEGKRLTTCFAAPGQARPAEFASVPGDGRTLTVWTPAGG
jgi:uncharacterized protein (TIGR03067 family)